MNNPGFRHTFSMTIWSALRKPGNPSSALAELIWNAVDVDATCIEVTLIDDA